MNDRPWQFILVTDKAVLEKLPMDNYTQAVKGRAGRHRCLRRQHKDFKMMPR
jgi:hypothetical protein